MHGTHILILMDVFQPKCLDRKYIKEKQGNLFKGNKSNVIFVGNANILSAEQHQHFMFRCQCRLSVLLWMNIDFFFSPFLICFFCLEFRYLFYKGIIQNSSKLYTYNWSIV